MIILLLINIIKTNKMKKNKIIYLFLLLNLSVISSFAQNSRNIGLTASIQDNQFGILIPIRFSNMITIAPAFSVQYAEKIGTDFSIGLVPKFYLKNEKLSPYFGLKFGAAINKPSSDNEIDNDTKIDIIGGIAFGAEYFFDDNFSIGVEAQGNLTQSDKKSIRFGNPDGTNFNTATMITATVYF